MIPPFAKTVDDATLKEAEEEVATVFAHLKKLLRVKNRLYFPLLRLPTETIVRILSFIMEDMGSHSVWSPIFSTCCHIATRRAYGGKWMYRLGGRRRLC